MNKYLMALTLLTAVVGCSSKVSQTPHALTPSLVQRISGGNRTQNESIAVCHQQTTDKDRDGVADHVDNCPKITNADQGDADGDSIGDMCDTNGGQCIGEFCCMDTGMTWDGQGCSTIRANPPVFSASNVCRHEPYTGTYRFPAMLVSVPRAAFITAHPGDTDVPLLDLYLVACEQISEWGIIAVIRAPTAGFDGGLRLSDGTTRFSQFQLVEEGVGVRYRANGFWAPHAPAYGGIGGIAANLTGRGTTLERIIPAGTVIHYTLLASIASEAPPIEDEMFVIDPTMGGVNGIMRMDAQIVGMSQMVFLSSN